MKNKKLFPDFEQGNSVASAAPASMPRFSLTSSFWETLERDPDVKREFEQRVERRAKEIIDSEAGPQKAAIFEGARQEGHSQGIAESRQEATRLFRDLEEVAASLLREKDRLLHGHERLWCEAISHLCQRFLIPLSVERLHGLGRWLEESVGDLSRQAKIRVVLAPAVFERIQSAAIDSAAQWEWSVDRALADSEIRVELVGGGLLFAPEVEAEKLTDKLCEILGTNANSP